MIRITRIKDRQLAAIRDYMHGGEGQPDQH